MSAATFRYRKIEPASCAGALLVLGYPTPGFVGLVATHYLAEAHNLSLVGAFEGGALDTRVVLRKGLPAPAVRLYVGAQVCGMDRQCDQLAVLVTDTPLPDELHREYAGAVLDWAENAGVRGAIALEAVPIGPGATLRGAASTPAALEDLRKQQVEPLDGVSIGGLTGALLAEAAERDFPLTVLFVEAHGDKQDPGAAASALEVVDRLVVNIPIETQPLKQAAEEFSRRLAADMEARRAQHEASHMYG